MSVGQAVAAVVLAVTSVLGAPPALAPSAPPPSASPSSPPTAAGVVPSGAGWEWPLRPEPQVVRGFDLPDQPWLAGHRGVDLGTSPGAPVYAPTVGRVSFSGTIAGRGVVVVAHSDGLRSTFEPVVSGPAVGTAVGGGDPIGSVGPTPGHCAPATCLHWGVLRGETYLDPLGFVGRAPIVLLPLS